MQQALQTLQYRYGIYNSEIEPEHESDYYCTCAIHMYKMMKYRRYGVQEMWSKAVMYPGKFIILSNPYDRLTLHAQARRRITTTI